MSEVKSKEVEYSGDRIPIPKGLSAKEVLATRRPSIWTDSFVKNSHGPWWEQCK